MSKDPFFWMNFKESALLSTYRNSIWPPENWPSAWRPSWARITGFSCVSFVESSEVPFNPDLLRRRSTALQQGEVCLVEVWYPFQMYRRDAFWTWFLEPRDNRTDLANRLSEFSSIPLIRCKLKRCVHRYRKSDWSPPQGYVLEVQVDKVVPLIDLAKRLPVINQNSRHSNLRLFPQLWGLRFQEWGLFTSDPPNQGGWYEFLVRFEQEKAFLMLEWNSVVEKNFIYAGHLQLLPEEKEHLETHSHLITAGVPFGDILIT